MGGARTHESREYKIRRLYEVKWYIMETRKNRKRNDNRNTAADDHDATRFQGKDFVAPGHLYRLGRRELLP